jgi:hypothetical protein
MIHFLLRSVRIAAMSMLQLPSAMMRMTPLSQLEFASTRGCPRHARF